MKPISLLLLLLTVFACNQQTSPTALTDADLATNNKGVGLMGQFQYAAAEELFRGLAEKHPDNDVLAINLAIATLNRQNPGDEQAALDILGQVLKRQPDHQTAQYCSGLLHLYLGNEDAAFTHFSAVEDDAYASYHVAQILANRGEIDQALALYEAVLKQDPYLRSAYYGAFRSYQQAGNRDRARTLLGDFQKLKDNPRAHLFEIKYTRMGPLAEVKTLDAKPPTTMPSGPLFGEAVALGNQEMRWRKPEGPTSLTAVDYDGDGDLDLFQVGALESDEGAINLIWQNDGQGNFSALEDHPYKTASDIRAVLWGDYDNDGLVDAYFCRNGFNQFWRQTPDNTWENVTGPTLTQGGDVNTVNGAFFDADHDGDLDLFLINENGPNELFNNNRDGSFRPIAREQGLDGGDRASRQVVTGDFDGDRDADILVIHAEPPHQVFLNDRLWSYRQSDAFSALEKEPLVSAFLTDMDGDGRFELVTVNKQAQVSSWHSNGQAWEPKALGTLNNAATDSSASYCLVDLDGDGRGEMVYLTTDNWAIAHLGDSTADLKISAGPGGKLGTFLPVVLNPQKGYALVGIQENGQPSLIPAGTGRHPFLSVQFSGKEDTGQAMRSNASGIGTEIAARAGSHWTITHNYPISAAPGQSHQPLALGLGGATTADFLALEWSDGVYQTELGMATDLTHFITETQRQLSSCPVIFAWDGESHRFVSDVLGVAGIGYAMGDGTYSNPRPWENFLMPKDLAKPKDGRFIFKVTEPMEEAAYIDSTHLAHYRMPEGWDMVIDERMWISGPKPTGKPLYYQKEIQPQRVVNDRGENVSQALAKADFEAAPIPGRDHRFLGRLSKNHQLVLTFAEPINGPDLQPVLVADGWVEYPYSQTMFAAWQAGAAFEAPTLEARDQAGIWRTVYKQFGYPAGMPRRMALPLPDLPAGTTALRLTSNLEIYWDRFSIVFAKPCQEAVKTVLAPTYATLIRSGFAKRTTGKDMLPQYDYQERVPLWDTRYMDGAYTQTGPMLPLVETADDALAIIGPGEEIHIEFDARDVSVDGNHRLVLEIRGWCKDMDLFTRDGETLGPLPNDGHPPVARTLLHARYNTRYQSGR